MFVVIPNQLLLHPQSVRLGRLVTNLEEPHEDYHDASFEGTPRHFKSDYEFSNEGLSSKAASFGANLTSLMSAKFSRQAESKITIEPTAGATDILDDSEGFFDRIVQSDKTREWIETRALRSQEIYMIVGIDTILDASILQSSGSGHQVKGSLNVPVSLSLAAAGLIVPFADLIDPEVHNGHRRTEGSQSRLLAVGEHVCALRYRKLVHRWFSSKTADNLRLSPTRYWSCTKGRKRAMYQKGDEDSEDMIGVDLEVKSTLTGEEWTVSNDGAIPVYVQME